MRILSILASPFLGDARPSRHVHAGLCVFAGLLIGALLGGPTSVRAQPDSLRPVQAQDLYRMQTVQDVHLSPHGRFVAYTVRSVASRPAQSNVPGSHRTQLYVTSTPGTRSPRLFTRGASGAHQPTWHPDGTHLAFVRPVRGTPQLFVVSLDGGEPYQLTDVPHGVQNPQWSPDGEKLLFASERPQSAVKRQTGTAAPSERPGRTARDLVRSPAPDTLLVLRHIQTLDPVDTLSFASTGRIQPRSDSSRPLQTPEGTDLPGPPASMSVDSLAALSSDSLRTLFERLRLRPDTVTVPVTPDTAAAPGGNRVQTRRWMNQNRKRGTALVSSRLDLQGEDRLQPLPTYRHHFVVEVPAGLRSGTPPRPEVRPVTTGYRSYGTAKWLPGGNQIVVSGMPPSSRHPDRVRRRNLYTVDLTQNRMQPLLRMPEYALTDPVLTSDGNTVAFRARPLSPRNDAKAELGLFALDGRSQPRFITSAFDQPVSSYRWSPDGWFLYATASSGGVRPLYRFTPFARDTSAEATQPRMSPDQPTSQVEFTFDSTMVEPAPHEQLTGPDRAVHAFDLTNATVVYTSTDPDTPSALYTNTVSFNNEKQLAAPNADWLSRRRLSSSEFLTDVSDSLAVTGRVTRPVGPDSLPRPWLVQIQGGPPELNTPPTPERWFERQYLAGRGLGLLEVFPRDTTGYGPALRPSSTPRASATSDVLALTDSVATLSWTDSTQVALGGTSYGATVASWLVQQTDRFEAGVGLNGIYDFPTFLDEGRAWRLLPQVLGRPNSRWQDLAALDVEAGDQPSSDTSASDTSAVTPRATLHRTSPITHADQINTPLLLLHGGADRRVGRSQSERMYKRLKILEQPVEYVRYPGVGHDISTSATPRQQLDRLVRTYEFLVRFLDFSRPAGATSPRP